MISSRPKTKIPLTTLDAILETLAAVLVVLLLMFVISSWARLPQTIPVHFNIQGEIDRYGSKSVLLVLVPVILLLYAMMTILSRYPWRYNYPVEITEENHIRQYVMATRLLRFIKLEIMALFTYMEAITVMAATSGKFALGVWFLPANLIMLTGTTAIYMVLAKKAR